MPTQAVHLPPVVKGANHRRLVVRNKFGSKTLDMKFDPNCTFCEAELQSEGRLQLLDGGVTVADITLPKRVGPLTVPPRPCDCPPPPEPVVEVVIKHDPHHRESIDVMAVARRHIKRRK